MDMNVYSRVDHTNNMKIPMKNNALDVARESFIVPKVYQIRKGWI